MKGPSNSQESSHVISMLLWISNGLGVSLNFSFSLNAEVNSILREK